MFERATRLRLRFPSSRGSINVEDVWQLPMTHDVHTSLESLADAMYAELEKAKKPSFIAKTKSAVTPEQQLRFDIVIHIIDARQDELKAKARKKANEEERKEILEILSDQASAKRKDQSEVTLRRRLAALDAE